MKHHVVAMQRIGYPDMNARKLLACPPEGALELVTLMVILPDANPQKGLLPRILGSRLFTRRVPIKSPKFLSPRRILTMLTERDKMLLSVISLNPGASVEQIAEQTKLKPHLVRYSLQRLRREGQILTQVIPEYFRIGLQRYTIYFSLPGGKRNREAVEDFLLRYDGVNWLAEISGDYQYTCAVIVRTLSCFASFLTRLAERSGGSWATLSVAPMLSIRQFAFASSGDQKNRQYFSQSPVENPDKLDHRDHQLLSLLCQYPDANDSTIARMLKTPTSSLKYRLSKLTSDGKISPRYYLPHFEAANLQVVRVLLRTRMFGGEAAQKIFELCRSWAMVFYFVEQVGEWGYEIGVFVSGPQDVVAFRNFLQEDLGSLIDSVTVITNSRMIKYSPYPLGSFFSEAPGALENAFKSSVRAVPFKSR